METYGRLVLSDAGMKINRRRASLETVEDVQLEQALEALRRARVETGRAEEVVKEFGFRRAVLVAVLCLLSLVAMGSLAVIVAGLSIGAYPWAAGAMVPLSGSGSLGVRAWRIYTESPGAERVE